MKQLHIALLDTDALQLLCTVRELNDVNCTCVHFSSIEALLRVLRRGAHFDGVLIALHGNGGCSIDELKSIRVSDPSGAINVMLIAHESELIYERKLVEKALLEGMGFLRSPIDRTEFLLRFERQAAAL
jgi:DNA-binding NtrC family response regulator